MRTCPRVVDPRHAEDDLPLGLAQALEHRGVDVVRVPVQHGTQALEHLGDRLVELALAGVPGEHLLEGVLQLQLHVDSALLSEDRETGRA